VRETDAAAPHPTPAGGLQGRESVGVLTDVKCFSYGSLVGLEHELWIPFHPGDFGMIAAEANSPIEVVSREQDTVMRTLKRMVASSQDFAVVVGGNNRLTGILTEHDGLRIAAAALPDNGLTVGVESSGPVHFTRGSSPAIEAMNRMDNNGFRHLAVLEGDQLIGVISRLDLVADNVRRRANLRVEDVMGERTLYTCTPSQTLAAAAETMLLHRIGCLPVVDANGRLVRILTRTDLIEAAVVALEASALFPAAPGLCA
jgi:CBS domain-containing protein